MNANSNSNLNHGIILISATRIARGMLRRFPTVGRYESADDVAQESVIRILRSLENLGDTFDATQLEGFILVHVKRTVIDLLRHYRGAHGAASNERELAPTFDAIDENNADQECWEALQSAIGELDDEEREVFIGAFRENLTQAELAQRMGCDERTIRRRYASAIATLRELVA